MSYQQQFTLVAPYLHKWKTVNCLRWALRGCDLNVDKIIKTAFDKGWIKRKETKTIAFPHKVKGKWAYKLK